MNPSIIKPSTSSQSEFLSPSRPLNTAEEPCLLETLKGHRGLVTGMKFHPDGTQLVTSSDDCTLMMWNLMQKSARSYKLSGHVEPVTDVDCTMSLVVSCSKDKSIRLWNCSLAKNHFSEIKKAHSASINSVNVSLDEKKIVTGSNDKSLKLWDVKRRKFISSYNGHNNWVNCVRFIPDGSKIISSADDKTIKVWDVNTKECINTFTNPAGNATKLAIHPNGNSILAAMSTGSARVYDIRNRKLVQHYKLHTNTLTVAWHPAGKHFITGGEDGSMKIVDALEGRPLYTVEPGDGPVMSAAFSVTGDYFACAGKLVMIWKTNIVNDENTPPCQPYFAEE